MNKILHLNVVLTQLSNQIYHFLYLFFNNNNIFNLWYWNYSTFTNYFLFKIIKNIARKKYKKKTVDDEIFHDREISQFHVNIMENNGRLKRRKN